MSSSRKVAPRLDIEQPLDDNPRHDETALEGHKGRFRIGRRRGHGPCARSPDPGFDPLHRYRPPSLLGELRFFDPLHRSRVADRFSRVSAHRYWRCCGVGAGERLTAAETIGWSRQQFSHAIRIAGNISRLFEGLLQEALGPAGTPSDLPQLAYVARTAADIYRDALEWALRTRRVTAPSAFTAPIAEQAKMLDPMIGETRAFPTLIRTELAQALAASVPGKPQIVNMTLTVRDNEGELPEDD
jgi:hypothetical protein